MNEYRVYYDDLGEFAVKTNNLCQEWLTQLKDIDDKICDFMAPGAIEGDSAETMRCYLWQIHHAAIESLKTLVNTLNTKSQGYYVDYCELDEGDGSKYGKRYTTFVASELMKGGVVEKRLDSIIGESDEIRRNLFAVYKDINAYTENSHTIPSNGRFRDSLKKAKKIATKLDSQIGHIESRNSSDFKDIDIIISSLTSLINNQLSSKRIPVVSYHSGEIHQICDTQSLIISVENCNKDIESFVSSGKAAKASALLSERQKLLYQEEKDSRQWVKWVSTGVTVLATTAVIVASASGVGIVGVVVIGAVTGSISGATSCVSDHYYEKGSLDNLDYNELLKKTVTGGIAGGIGGYTSAVAFAAKAGGVALTTVDKTIVVLTEESAKTVTNISVDTGAVIGYELNRVITGDDTGVQRQYDTLKKDTNEGVKNIVVKPMKAYVGGVIEDDFKTNDDIGNLKKELKHLTKGEETSIKKNVIKKGFEKGGKNLVKTAATETTEQAISMTYDAVTGKYSGANGSKEFEKDLRKGWTKVAGKSTSAFISGTASSVTNEKVDSIKHTYIREPMKVVNDTFNGTVSSVAEKVSTKAANNVISNADERERVTLSEIWDDTLQGGRSIVKELADSAAGEAGSRINEDHLAKERENRHKGMLYEEIRDGYLYEEVN